MAFFRPVDKSFPCKLCPLLSLAAMCASIAYCNKRSPCSWRRVSWIQRGAGDEEEEVGFYLSFSKQDIGDDVRETPAQHQHHTVLAVSDTRHLRRGDSITSSLIFIWNLHRGSISALTSAPRRLSEHILQKESRACRKAGDNFLRHHKQHESSHSHRASACTPQLTVPLTSDWLTGDLTEATPPV